MILGLIGNSLQKKYKNSINNMRSGKDKVLTPLNVSRISIYYTQDSSKSAIKQYSLKDNSLLIEGDVYKCMGTNNTPKAVWELYKKQGNSFLDHLNGSFILVLQDTENTQIVITADKMNTRPVFYCLEEDGFVFSSDLRLLARFLQRTVSIDPLVLMKYITFCYNPGSQTFFQGIQRLLPGHYLGWKQGTVTVQK